MEVSMKNEEEIKKPIVKVPVPKPKKKQKKKAKPAKPQTPTSKPEPIINISAFDFATGIKMNETIRVLFFRFYKKINVNWMSKSEWNLQWDKFRKMSPTKLDKARKKGVRL